jgi:hypothetical protein
MWNEEEDRGSSEFAKVQAVNILPDLKPFKFISVSVDLRKKQLQQKFGH